jgi:hypothetical protein
MMKLKNNASAYAPATPSYFHGGKYYLPCCRSKGLNNPDYSSNNILAIMRTRFYILSFLN